MTSLNFNSARLAAAVALAALALGTGSAGALSNKVKNACSNDYYKFCPSHPVGSTSLDQCMRQVGKRLSPRCIDALRDSGEIRRSAKR